ncbi:MAG: hypothetical protein IMW90_16875 [Thermogemmatispora sp.]|uniref:hypothetical protein n=1 Tax=Thermogemmatispora sp. TaxID=1968838 RepID=UPI0019EA4D82|nr:hypothetical protein [Thermogemmatispora sp.]MBE3567391.1 hypothetical protein [Thermogemmatispora sp.]
MGHDSSISGVQILGASPSQTDITKALIAIPGGPASPSTWQWLFELRALPPEERLIKARPLGCLQSRSADRRSRLQYSSRPL